MSSRAPVLTPAATEENVSAGAPRFVRVALDVPLPGLFDYRIAQLAQPGQRVVVPFGRRQLIGLVVAVTDQPEVPVDQCRDVIMLLDDLPPLPAAWIRLMEFASRYYQRPLGEVVMPSLPPPCARRRRIPASGQREGQWPA